MTETDGGHVNFGIPKEQKLDGDLRKGVLITTQISLIKACGRHTPQRSRMGLQLPTQRNSLVEIEARAAPGGHGKGLQRVSPSELI